MSLFCLNQMFWHRWPTLWLLPTNTKPNLNCQVCGHRPVGGAHLPEDVFRAGLLRLGRGRGRAHRGARNRKIPGPAVRRRLRHRFSPFLRFLLRFCFCVKLRKKSSMCLFKTIHSRKKRIKAVKILSVGFIKRPTKFWITSKIWSMNAI